ncbi:MAG TPA: anti-sigma factor [Pyrinomonadaceae bacterium]|nr:anti-sigma factor [Pyrinomonadaceae bacterium]
MKHEEYKELIALEALDALERGADEQRALEAHLASCADCRAELRALSEAAASLAYVASTPEAPAPELRARILAAVKSHPQDTPHGRHTKDGNSGGASGVSSSLSSGVSSPEEFERRREAREVRVGRRLLMFGSVAASIAVAALLVALAVLWQRNNQLRTELTRLSETVNRTQEELARTRADRELLAAPGAHTATLAGTKAAERARARLTFDAQTGRAMLMAADLPPAPAGKAYQLWFIAEGKPPMPGSVFRPDANGHAEMHETIPPEGRNASVFAVTLEPAGGVSAPTGEMYLKSSAS